MLWKYQLTENKSCLFKFSNEVLFYKIYSTPYFKIFHSMKKRKVLLSNEKSIAVISNENEWIAFIALDIKINNIFLN